MKNSFGIGEGQAWFRGIGISEPGYHVPNWGVPTKIRKIMADDDVVSALALVYALGRKRPKV